MTPLQTALARLRELEAGATGGPWGWESHGEKCNCAILGTFYNRLGDLIPGHVHSEEYDEAIGDYKRVADCDEVIAAKEDDAKYPDFAFIAQLRNSSPALIALVEAMAAEIEAHRLYWQTEGNSAGVSEAMRIATDSATRNFTESGKK